MRRRQFFMDRQDPHQPDQSEREAFVLGHEQRHVPEQRGLLHERARERNADADPENAEVAIAKGREHRGHEQSIRSPC